MLENSSQKTVLHLSAMDYSGAGYFALDFHRFVQGEGYRSFLVVKDARSGSPDVLLYPDAKVYRLCSKLLRRFAKYRDSLVRYDYNYYFYNRYERYTTVSARRILDLLPACPEVIFVHWVTDFINAKTIGELFRLTGARIYMLMVDNAPITGGCHYPWNCQGFTEDCGKCPAIMSPRAQWLSMANLRFKQKHLPDDICLVAFSESDAERARRSAIFRDRKIVKLLGFVDENKFRPGSKELAKASFHIPYDQRVVFFGASSLKEKRKGMDILLKAIKLVRSENVIYLVAGNAALPFENKNIILAGHLDETRLVEAYQAADVFVCPSIEDSGPMMINQSLMSGTPVVAFDTGVAQDLVINGRTGYRARIGDAVDLAHGLEELIQLEGEDYRKLASECRKVAVAQFGAIRFRQTIRHLLMSCVSTDHQQSVN